MEEPRRGAWRVPAVVGLIVLLTGGGVYFALAQATDGTFGDWFGGATPSVLATEDLPAPPTSSEPPPSAAPSTPATTTPTPDPTTEPEPTPEPEPTTEPTPEPPVIPGAEQHPVDCHVTKCVALTYDDGPGDDTERLLDVLAEKGAKVTFFVQGWRVEQAPDTVRREINEGHEIGNHSWNHKNFAELSADDVRGQINRTSDLVEQLTGVRPATCRPPYGSTSGTVLQSMHDVGTPAILWNVDTLDWSTLDAEKTFQSAINDSVPGAIVLMHDIHSPTVDAAGRIVDELRARGYALVTISELFGPDYQWSWDITYGRGPYPE